MSPSQQEGVIKFDLDFHPGQAPAADLVKELEAWRTIFKRLGLLGQDPGRYDGFGFGNLSRRLPGWSDGAFVISGTQTGGLTTLSPDQYVIVQSCDPATNRVTASGPVKPSSEALTHGVLYHASPAISWVMHLHSPEIFHCSRHFDLPGTDPNAAYGTPEMAAEIDRLAKSLPGDQAHLVIMSGHEDGILAFGTDAEETGALVITALARALEKCVT